MDPSSAPLHRGRNVSVPGAGWNIPRDVHARAPVLSTCLGSLNLQNLIPDTVFHSHSVKHPENLFPAQSWASTTPLPSQELCLLALQGIFNEYLKQTVNDGFYRGGC